MLSSHPQGVGKRIWGWTKLIIFVYFALGIAFFFLQDYLLFHPAPVQKNIPYGFSFPFREFNIPYDQQHNLNIIQFKTEEALVRGVVLYFHGNKGNISAYAKYTPAFTSHGYELWMMDYPGFGKSTGKFTDEQVYAYSLQCYKLARTRFEPNQIIIYGKSLGTGVGAQLASIRDCKRLILETPYFNMETMVGHFLPIFPIGLLLRYHFSTAESIPRVTAPITIFHGTNDLLIPYRNAQRLVPLLKPGDEFISINKGSHNDLNDFPLFRTKLDSLLSL
jgi:pimeloyl-ACP methyl ester carboxylesterase